DMPWIRRAEYGIRAMAGPDAIEIRTPVRLIGHNFTHTADFEISEGQDVPFALTWYESHRSAPHGQEAQKLLEATEKWWGNWSSRYKETGVWRDAVMRSLITLKALTFAETGGIVAAPTTSLPEALGGVRNWDYRFCWLRDATLTLYALLIAGYTSEAREWRGMVGCAGAGGPPDTADKFRIPGRAPVDAPGLP